MNKEYTPDPRGLYGKYVVTKSEDGSDVGDCFVLRIPDPHARKAMLAYADSVLEENPNLALDLYKKVSIYVGNRKHSEDEDAE